MQELDKCNLKINVIRNGLEKYISFSINNKPSFIDSFQFLGCSLDSLVKNLGKDDFKYLSQEFDNNVLDLVRQKAKKSFRVRCKVKKLLTINMIMFLRFGII